MALWIEEDLNMGDVLRGCLFQVGEGEIEEILPFAQNRHAQIIQVEKILQ